MRGRQVLMQTLINHGVDRIFGNPGTTESPLLDSLLDHPQIQYIVHLHEGVAVEVRTQILGVDTKRVHLFHTLHRQMDGRLLAPNEQMLSNIDVSNPSTGPRTAPFLPAVAGLLLPLAQAHADLPRPANAGRSIALPKLV